MTSAHCSGLPWKVPTRRRVVASLAQRYSYVVPDNRSLGILAGVAPLVESERAPGTGRLDSELLASTSSPSTRRPGGARINRYHATAQTWTDVIAGDQTLLTEFADRSLFLCWPPLFSSRGLSELLRRRYRCVD